MSEEKEIGSRFGETADLPAELRRELSRKTAKYSAIVEYIDVEFNGIATIDELLVVHYRKTGEVLKRSALIQELYRLFRAGVIFPVKGKKGWYTTSKKTAKSFTDGKDNANGWWN